MTPFFREAVQWSGETPTVEAWNWDDGILAIVLGAGVVVACAVAAGLIALFYEAGRLLR